MSKDTSARVAARVKDILTSDETIERVAVQNRLVVVNLLPRALILTNHRLILYRPRLFGRMRVEHFRWRDVRGAELDEGILGATFRILATENRSAEVPFLPRTPARRVCALVQERMEQARDEQRARDAKTPPAHRADPSERLRKLDGLFAARLISSREYADRRDRILSET